MSTWAKISIQYLLYSTYKSLPYYDSSQLIHKFCVCFFKQVWDSVLYRPYCFDMTNNLYTLLQHVMWRTCKADVEDQVLIHNSCKTTFSSHVNVHQDSPSLLHLSLCIDELCIFQ